MSIAVSVDPTNPGQFFACCGLLELADRLWPGGAEGCFVDDDRAFRIDGDGTLPELVAAVASAKLSPVEDDIYSTPVAVGDIRRPFVLNWWHPSGGRADAKDLKVWAGTMESCGIAQAMQKAMRDEKFRVPGLFDLGMVVPDAANLDKKKEPYYFDARRGPNAHSRDVGFSPNDLSMPTDAFPAVEFLCLVGLQRCQPVRVDPRTRLYDYATWATPLPPPLLPAAVAGHLGGRVYRFENWFRTGQKKHKAFRPAIPLTKEAADE